MDDFGGYDFGSNFGDTSDFNTTYGGDLISQFDVANDPGGLGDWSGYSQTANYPASPYYTPGSPGATGAPSGLLGSLFGGGGAGSGGAGGGASPWLAGALGAAGPLAGLLGTLASGGLGPKPVMGVPQTAALNQSYAANQQLGQFAQGNSPLQQEQGNLLRMIQQGQIPQSITDLVRSAYSPVMQNLWTDAAEAGRRAGFHDAPATSPVGSNVLGPGLAQAQGQMAGDILKQMTSLPGLYQNPINAQIGAANDQAGGFSNLGSRYTPQTQTPLGAQVGQGLGNAIGGAAQGYGAQQTQQQQSLLNQNQQNFQNSMLQLMQQQARQGNNTNMSGAAPNQFQQYDQAI